MAERLDKLGKEEWVDARIPEACKVEAMDDAQRAQYKRLDAHFQLADGALRALEEVYSLRAQLESRDQRIARLVAIAKAAAAHFDLAGTHSQADVEDRFFDLNRSLKAIQPGDLDD